MPLTNVSKDFIKAATCAPDNNLTPRIPDGSGSRTFTQKFSKQVAVECNPGDTLMIVCTPTLPIAAYSVSYNTAAGYLPAAGLYPTLLSSGSEYLETKTEFPEWESLIAPTGVSNTSSVDAGRIISLSAELECTTNAFNQYGTVSCFKTPLALTSTPDVLSGGAIAPSTLQVTGGAALPPQGVTTGAYLAPVRNGAYAVSMNREGGTGLFLFSDFLNNTWQGETMYCTINGTAGGVDRIPFKGVPFLWDNSYDTIVFKITVPAGVPSAQSFILKNWVTVEMRTVYGSFLHGIASPAPPRDPQAFKLYGAIQDNLPEAVPSKDNPDFWNTILSIIKPISGVASLIPGPIGTVAKGVHAVSSVLSPDSSQSKVKAEFGGKQITLKNKSKRRNRRRRQTPQIQSIPNQSRKLK